MAASNAPGAGEFNPQRPRIGGFGKPTRKKFRPRKGKKHHHHHPKAPNTLDQPYGQTVLTGREAIQEARRAAGYKYGEADRMLGRELGGVPGQQKQIDVAYNLYGQKLANLAQNTQAAYSQFQQAAYNQANQDTAQVQQGAVPGSELSQQVANAAAVRNANTVNFGGMIGAQGASQTAYTNDQSRIGELGRIGAHTQEQAYERELRAKRRDLKKERGQYRGEVLRQIRDDERQWTLEQVAFKVDQFNAQQDAANARRDDRESSRHNKAMERNTRASTRATERNNKRTNRTSRKNNQRTNQQSNVNNQRTNRPDSGGGDPNHTSAERRQGRAKYDQAVSIARAELRDEYGGNEGEFRGNRARIIDLLAAKISDRAIAIAAVDTVLRGGARRKTRKTIRHRYGTKGIPHIKPGSDDGANSIEGITG